MLGEILFLHERDYAGGRAHWERAVEQDAFALHAAWLQSNLQELRDNFGGALAGLDSLRSMFPEYLPLSADVLFTRLLVGDSTRGNEPLQYWVGLLGGRDDLAAELSAGNVVGALRRLTAEADPAP
ncbi:MAG: hypothetical protein V3S56_00905, partial [Gemmatimonadota bacterium]